MFLFVINNYFYTVKDLVLELLTQKSVKFNKNTIAVSLMFSYSADVVINLTDSSVSQSGRAVAELISISGCGQCVCCRTSFSEHRSSSSSSSPFDLHLHNYWIIASGRVEGVKVNK